MVDQSPALEKPGSRPGITPKVEKPTIRRELPVVLENLPIAAFAREIQEKAIENDSLIIVGETGSGKTTQIPLILRSIMGENDRIAVTQPRKVAARSVTRFVADQVGCKIGEEVGYKIRFDDQTEEGTLVNFMTDGILLREMLADPLLSKYTIVMVDEAHERSLNIDLTLGLLKVIQKVRKEKGAEPLKIVVTSATIEKEKFSKFFNNAPTIDIPGRIHPINIHYEKETPSDYIKAASEKVREIVESGKDGDILIFMPGEDDINKTIKKIEEISIPNIQLLPLHGRLSPEDQDRIFDSSDKRRKVIISTNIAETSVTVPKVRHVIDTGLIKQKVYNPDSGIEALVVTKHAKSGCIQRAGRAGRVAPGDCYRLYSKEDFEEREQFELPEIQRSNIAHVVLSMKQLGIKNVESFEFIDPPEEEAFENAIKSLKSLGALDNEGNLTEIGRIMAELPLEPHISRMLIEANIHGCVEEIATIVSFLGGRPVFIRPEKLEYEADSKHRAFKDRNSDFLTLLNVWRGYEEKVREYEEKVREWNKQSIEYKKKNPYPIGVEVWVRNNFLNIKVLNEVKDVREQLFRILEKNGIKRNSSEDKNAIGKSIAAGLADNLIRLYAKYSYIRPRDGESNLFIHPSSVTFGQNPQFVVSAEIVETSKKYARVCQIVEPEWVRDIVPSLVKEVPEHAYYDRDRDQVVCYYSLFLNYSLNPYLEEERVITGEKAVDEFCEALSDGTFKDMPFDFGMLFIVTNLELLTTLNKYYIRSGGKTTKPITSEELAGFYKSRLKTISSVREIKKALQEGTLKITDLLLSLDDFIPPKEQNIIARDNPDEIYIGEKSYPVSYIDNSWGEERFVAHVRIPTDEIFGIKEFPKIPSGKKTLILLVDKDSNNLIRGDDLERVKREAKKHLIDEQWNSWSSFPTGRTRKELPDFDLNTPIDLPEPVEFGIDPETKKPLYAYPAIARDHYYTLGRDYFSIRFFPTIEQAEIAKREFELYKEGINAPKVPKPPSREFLGGLPKVPPLPSYYETSWGQKRSNASEREKSALEIINGKSTDEQIKDLSLLAQRSGKPRVRALTQAVLIEKGLEVMERAGIKKEIFPDVLQELNLALKEARGKYNSNEIQEITNLINSVETVKTAIQQSETEKVRDFLGESKEEKRRFQIEFLKLVGKRGMPKTKEDTDSLIDEVLDRMTL